ncbi:hypothetical protein LB941_11255 [Ligilactobacillus sp. WILCCON 0076]|uniref:Uncharacterized protein n=1 Tax=Ligilactobacillus ubinensis TaxID=2876789 RepID=A0A9X2JMB6_9LACO|nr:hypothetical protein [Ligilactobacillus ubinensis]MCP0887907.1 hypothetical protein [Ligilactobacillus ubinensis]
MDNTFNKIKKIIYIILMVISFVFSIVFRDGYLLTISSLLAILNVYFWLEKKYLRGN